MPALAALPARSTQSDDPSVGDRDREADGVVVLRQVREPVPVALPFLKRSGGRIWFALDLTSGRCTWPCPDVPPRAITKTCEPRQAVA